MSKAYELYNTVTEKKKHSELQWEFVTSWNHTGNSIK